MKPTPLIAGLSVLIAGCHQKTPSDAGPPTTATTSPAAEARVAGQSGANSPVPGAGTKPLPAPPPAVAGRADNYLRENVAGDPDPFLTGQLRTFIEQKHRMPESFAEFAMSRLDSIPRPPEGKKWVIDIAALQVKASPAK
jgi:hypothetical protein